MARTIRAQNATAKLYKLTREAALKEFPNLTGGASFESLNMKGDVLRVAVVNAPLPYSFKEVVDLLYDNSYPGEFDVIYRRMQSGPVLMSDPFRIAIFSADGVHLFCDDTEDSHWPFHRAVERYMRSRVALSYGDPYSLSSFFFRRPKLRQAIWDHYSSGELSMSAVRVKEIEREIRDSEDGRFLLECPEQYKYAYRFIEGVPLPIDANARKTSAVSVHGPGTLKTIKRRRTSSWSCSLAATKDFAEPEMTNDGGYAAVFRAKISSGQFLFNPDVLPFYVGQAEFLYQVEVMGVGAVAYDKAASLWFPKGHGKGASLTSLFNAVK